LSRSHSREVEADIGEETSLNKGHGHVRILCLVDDILLGFEEAEVGDLKVVLGPVGAELGGDESDKVAGAGECWEELGLGRETGRADSRAEQVSKCVFLVLSGLTHSRMLMPCTALSKEAPSSASKSMARASTPAGMRVVSEPDRCRTTNLIDPSWCSLASEAKVGFPTRPLCPISPTVLTIVDSWV
jgi:hypothetical protein